MVDDAAVPVRDESGEPRLTRARRDAVDFFFSVASAIDVSQTFRPPQRRAPRRAGPPPWLDTLSPIGLSSSPWSGRWRRRCAVARASPLRRSVLPKPFPAHHDELRHRGLDLRVRVDRRVEVSARRECRRRPWSRRASRALSVRRYGPRQPSGRQAFCRLYPAPSRNRGGATGRPPGGRCRLLRMAEPRKPRIRTPRRRSHTMSVVACGLRRAGPDTVRARAVDVCGKRDRPRTRTSCSPATCSARTPPAVSPSSARRRSTSAAITSPARPRPNDRAASCSPASARAAAQRLRGRLQAGVEVVGEGGHRIEQVTAAADVEAGFRVDNNGNTLRSDTGGGRHHQRHRLRRAQRPQPPRRQHHRDRRFAAGADRVPRRRQPHRLRGNTRRPTTGSSASTSTSRRAQRAARQHGQRQRQ